MSRLLPGASGDPDASGGSDAAPVYESRPVGAAPAGRPAASRAARPGTALLTAARRTVTTALLLALIPAVAAVLIAVTVLGAPVSLPSRGPWRPSRMACFVLVYLLVDLSGLLAATALFLRAPRATRERRAAEAFALLARLLAVLRGSAERLFRLRVETTPAPPTAVRTSAPDTPLVVFVRHAGLGDSFLLLQLLLTEAGLLPHTVLKGVLRADPCLDVLLGRVPHCFLPPADGTAENAIGALAAGLRPRDALVIFPEGGNFTPHRHRRAVAALRRLGQYRRAARAARLRYVLPPRDAGSLAILAAAPTADVVFVGHAGLDVIASPRAAWSFLPFRGPVRVHWWRVPAAEIPAGDAARSEWLLGQWERMDRWTAAQAVPATPHA
ncbi:hypothetical protein SAMN05216251_117159 [Actinacidiphila alni]|uniref:Phospholipid/glycerol acyltransferase domain-containing protein n=1 Tax=Actinacidiphila alni TaxID=380248 RepID=A0A1I2JFD2_9ACTN|nr:hypothetical protein [Actinacidiphila alni]SFF52808.1 hypothetical protein SAMN05216251_117159 [Actinacidiphila alni]